VVDISRKINGVDLKVFKSSMDETSNKLSDIDTIYKKINDMDYFFRKLGDMEQGLKAWGENHDELKALVASLENGNKELNIHSFYSHHSFFPPPKHSSNFRSFKGFTHKMSSNISIFDGEDDKDLTRWTNRHEHYLELQKMCDDNDKNKFSSLHLENAKSDGFLWWHSKSQSR
jgi:hypothetical protein